LLLLSLGSPSQISGTSIANSHFIKFDLLVLFAKEKYSILLWLDSLEKLGLFDVVLPLFPP